MSPVARDLAIEAEMQARYHVAITQDAPSPDNLLLLDTADLSGTPRSTAVTACISRIPEPSPRPRWPASAQL
ncbi:hypothetical protein ACFYYR_04550 [Streptomyces sp. NPDC001922]|uniref:hypothetical protein n=1 Tax=Streptomyces sp. NPDC001922 TaxID=3364624 RepID=UPI0036ABD4D3